MKFTFFLLLYLAGTISAPARECGQNQRDPDRPDYPSLVVHEILFCSPGVQNKVIITEFEKLLIRKEFKLPVQKKGDNYHIDLGLAGPYSLWRDLINLNLGRAYYEEGEDQKALTYWKRVPTGSFLSVMSRLQSHYAYFRLKNIEAVKNSLKTLQDLKSSHELYPEYQLHQAWVALWQKEYVLSTGFVQGLKFSSPELEDLRLKISAEALFGNYLNHHIKMSFKEKLTHLKKIGSLLDQISVKGRDGLVAYLAAEAHWHTAVAYRIEDPDKYSTLWREELQIADNWISPFVDKSIRETKAYLNEEAYFFSIALLWEKEEHAPALVRLKALDKIFPNGIYREDVYQLLGDYYFDQTEFNMSLPYYRRLAQIGSESKAAYGVYKAAWSFYNAGEKWKSLRHFERLFQYYLARKQQAPEDKHELMKESRQDLLLVISEILPSHEGIKEIQTFHLPEVENRQMIHDLGKLYQRNGNYKESTLTWRYLLDTHLGVEKAPSWIMELANDLYADGKRMAISEAIKTYYPRWKKEYPAPKGDALIGSEWSRIILSLHREAKKSEDPEFWKAADKAYETYAQIRPDGAEGEVWYFGAQRFHQLEKIWKSVEWYRNAANVPGYAQRDDAALSALGLMHDKMGELSLAENKLSALEDYEKIAHYSQWFYQRASQKLQKQKELAHHIFTEALFHSQKHLEARIFLKELFENQELEDSWKIFLSHNQRLIRSKLWEEAYTLAVTLLQTRLGKTRESATHLSHIAQENAFQYAFESEGRDKLKARQWYRISFEVEGGDKSLNIKAWHNYLLTYDPSDVLAFHQDLEEFLRVSKAGSELESSTHELYFNIYSKALKVYDEARWFHKKARVYYLASLHTQDAKQAELLKWDSLSGHANYHEWEEFEGRLEELRQQKSSLLEAPRYQVALARFFLAQGEDERSWEMLSPILLKKDTPVESWPVVVDLFHRGSVQQSILDYLNAHEAELKENIWIRPLWAQARREQFHKASDLSAFALARTPAGHDGAETPEVKAFKQRFEEVSFLFKVMNAKKALLRSAIISWIPATATSAFCQGPLITMEAILSLHKLKKDPIRSERWSEFVQKLDEKGAELEQLKEREILTCERLKDEAFFVGGFELPKSPLCRKGCASFNPVASKHLLNPAASQDEFFLNLQRGSLLLAEQVAAGQSDPQIKTYYYSLIRLASGDVWNAFILLEDLQKHASWKNKSSFIKSRIASFNGREQLANSLIPPDAANLTDSERKLFD